jgi:hypothetical protein
MIGDLVLDLKRIISNKVTTIGVLRSEKLTLWTLEDEHRAVKVKGQTRIPQGIYEIIYRKEGGMLSDYKNLFPDHPGMLWLQNVPDFEYVYIHVGNNQLHTDGCILVGMGCILNGDYSITDSRTAYMAIYREIQQAFNDGRKVFISIQDKDQFLNE